METSITNLKKKQQHKFPELYLKQERVNDEQGVILIVYSQTLCYGTARN